MNKHKGILSALFLLALLLASCLDENNKSDVLYENAPGTIRVSESIIYIELDFLDVNLYPANLNPASWEDGERVSVTFRIDKSKQTGDKYWDNVSLLDIYKIPRKDILEWSPDFDYSDDMITEIQKKWITDNILNFDIKFTSTNAEKHAFNLTYHYYPEHIRALRDTIVLILYHNAFGDTESKTNERHYYCFSLDKLLPLYEKKDSIVLKINAKAINPMKNEYIVYRFKR